MDGDASSGVPHSDHSKRQSANIGRRSLINVSIYEIQTLMVVTVTMYVLACSFRRAATIECPTLSPLRIKANLMLCEL
jgi:hypothetical protein